MLLSLRFESTSMETENQKISTMQIQMGNQNRSPKTNKSNKGIHKANLKNMNLKQAKQDSSILAKLENLFFDRYLPQEKVTIYSIFEAWNSDQLPNIMKNDNMTKLQTLKYYRQLEPLSARVYDRVLRFIKSVDKKCPKDMDFSFNRFLFTQRSKKFQSRFEMDAQSLKNQKIKSLKFANECIQIVKKQNATLKKCFQFMETIDLLCLQVNKKLENCFLTNLERISTSQQRQLYIVSMKLSGFESLRKLNSKKIEQEKHILKTLYPNYFHYIQNTNKSIQGLHKKQGDYQFLQRCHDYIQWMFPNHYGSSFNGEARPLNYIESRLFYLDKKIGLKMLNSIKIFFDFLGIELHDQPLGLKLINKQRLKDALVINTHNHLRIMRVLACLSVTGFRRIALQLIDFLDYQTQNGGIAQKFRSKFEKNWKIYGESSQDSGKQMCFLQTEDYPGDHSVLQEICQTNKNNGSTEDNEGTSEKKESEQQCD